MNKDQPIPWTSAEVVTATKGELLSGGADQSFANIGIDSRAIASDELYVAIVGEVHDGHQFCKEALRQGARGLVVAKDQAGQLPIADWDGQGVICVGVSDTTRALGDLAAFNRKRAGVGVIGITGSNGKTTTRKFTAAVVGQEHNTLATIGNLNNAIGLPLTLLRLTPSHKWAVLELGTNHPGEIAYLAEISTPQIGVITNIAPAHLEGLGTLDGVMRAKGELLQKLATEGQAVLNADDPRVLKLARECRKPVVLFGTVPDADVRASEIQDSADGLIFNLTIAGEQIGIDIHIPGRFMVTNALAAAAVGHLLGLSMESIKRGLNQVQAESGRMAIIRTRRAITIVDDAYNANPASMQAAFGALSSMRGGARGILVLGDMLELGEGAADWHRKIGAAAAASGADKLYFFGDYAELAAEAARSEDMPTRNIFIGTQAEIADDLKRSLSPGDWLLIKGSRGMQMDKIVAVIKEWADAPEDG